MRLQKRLAADVLKVSSKRVWFDPARTIDISEAITKHDIRELISEGAIKPVQEKGISRSRANKRQRQYRKGLRRGWGSRKGTSTARKPGKERWMSKIRIQRKFLQELRDKEIITTMTYRKLYSMAKGGFFRSKRHIKIILEERELVKEGKK